MKGFPQRLQRLEAQCDQRTIRRMAQTASVHLGIDAVELAQELTQVLAECRQAGAVTCDETLRFLADQGRMTADELQAEAEALRKAMG